MELSLTVARLSDSIVSNYRWKGSYGNTHRVKILTFFQKAIHEPELVKGFLSPFLLFDNLNDFWVSDKIHKSSREGFGRRVNSSYCERELCSNIINLLSLRNLDHPSNSV